MQTALWFGAQDIAGSAHAAGFGLYRSDGSAKPAAGAFRALDGGIAPAPCGGVVDGSGPSIEIAEPLDGTRFVDMIDIDAKGVDSAGGVGIARIKMYADGKFERTFGDGHARISPWWPSRYWKRGKHTLTFKAIDEANNVITKSVTVYKVRRLATSAKLALEQLGPSTVKVTGRVSSPMAPRRQAGRQGDRRVPEARAGRSGRPCTGSAAARAGRSRSPSASSAGRWRVFLRYPGQEGLQAVALEAAALRDRLSVSAGTAGSRGASSARGRVTPRPGLEPLQRARPTASRRSPRPRRRGPCRRRRAGCGRAGRRP